MISHATTVRARRGDQDTAYRVPESDYIDVEVLEDPSSGPSESRKAGDVLANLLGFMDPKRPGSFGRFVVSPKGIATAGGLATLAGLVNAAGEFNNPDPTRTGFQNLASGVGAGLGTVGGTLAGGAAGRVLGGMLGAPGGPIGVLVGSTLGGLVGGEALKGLGGAVARAIEGGPEQQALNQARRQAELALEMEKQRMETLTPLQLATARAMQDLRAKDELNRSLSALMQQSAAGSAAQQVALTQALLGG